MANDRFLIRKRTLHVTASNGWFWPRLCQNTHARNGISKSPAKTRTSVASFGILGVKIKTRRLYASSGNCAESFYTASANSGHSALLKPAI
jgi:hypothetical protein